MLLHQWLVHYMMNHRTSTLVGLRSEGTKTNIVGMSIGTVQTKE